MARPKLKKRVTDFLREISSEAETITDDGRVISKAEALAVLLFNKALGHVEKTISDEGEEIETVYRPEVWAIQLVYDRLDGKVPIALEEQEEPITASERVSELAKNRLNNIANGFISQPSSNTPPPPPPAPGGK